MKLIKSLYRLSGVSGILVLENSRNNRALLIRTTDALGALSRILRSLKSRNKRWTLLRKDINKLSIKMVTEDSSRISFQYWVNHYESLGYQLYSKYKAIEYRVKIDVIHEDSQGHAYYAIVKLVTLNKKELIVGVFDTIEEAQEFSKVTYPDGRVSSIIYGINERSREYLSKKKNR